MPSFPIVDSHLHIWDPGRLTYPWLKDIPSLNRPFLLEDYRQACGPVEVEAMVFLQCEADFSQFLDEAAWVADQAQADPRIKAMVPWAPLELGDAARPHIEGLRRFELLRGVRRIIQFEPDVDYCLRPGFVAGVRALADYGLSFDICIDDRHMANVITLADLCPATPMVLDHVGKPCVREGRVEPWASQLRELARRGNVVCKLSGLATEADHGAWTPEQLKPFIMAALDAFGPDRLMFGGDWPVATQAVAYARWVEVLDAALAGLSEPELRRIFGGTARSFYRF